MLKLAECITSVTELKQLFGQNFLYNEQIIQRIVQIVDAEKQDHLVEIGAGKGALTKRFRDLPERFDIIELDRAFFPTLYKLTQKNKNCFIHQADVLHFDFKEISKGKKMRFIGNLPYSISTPLIFHLLTFRDYIKDMHFMLQREVAERLVAQPNTKTYGRLSVMAQYHCQIALLFIAAPECFKPKPKVQSAFVRIVPRNEYMIAAHDIEFFAQVVRCAFAQRRKIIKNSLKNLFSKEQMRSFEKTLGISRNARAEQLSVADFVKISNELACGYFVPRDASHPML